MWSPIITIKILKPFFFNIKSKNKDSLLHLVSATREFQWQKSSKQWHCTWSHVNYMFHNKWLKSGPRERIVFFVIKTLPQSTRFWIIFRELLFYRSCMESVQLALILSLNYTLHERLNVTSIKLNIGLGTSLTCDVLLGVLLIILKLFLNRIHSVAWLKIISSTSPMVGIYLLRNIWN